MATGWGKKTWGAEAWGDLSDTSVNLSGLSLTSTIGNETHVIDHQVTLTGLQLTSTQGSAVGGTSALVSVTNPLKDSSAFCALIISSVTPTSIAVILAS